MIDIINHWFKYDCTIAIISQILNLLITIKINGVDYGL